MSLLWQNLERFILRVPQDQQKRFRDEVCHQNVVIMRTLSWVNVIIMTVLLVIEVLSPADHPLSAGLRVYVPLRIAMVTLCIGFVLLARRPRSADGIVLLHHVAVIAMAVLLCILAAVWVGLTQPWSSTITVYLIVIFAASSAVRLSAWERGLALGTGLLFLIGFVNASQADPLIRTHHVVNGTVLTILSFCIGQLGWRSSVQRFLDRLTIERQAAELRRLSLEDELTGLANRRHAQQKLEEEWHRGMRSGQPLSLIMLDIDHFKAFNDDYGHVAGDQALQQVAHVLKSEVQRGTDLVTRYGGEEFLVLLSETGATGAKRIAHRLRQAVWDLDIPHVGSEHGRITVSLGVATMSCTAETRLQALVEVADQRLYRAKREGRNRAVS